MRVDVDRRSLLGAGLALGIVSPGLAQGRPEEGRKVVVTDAIAGGYAGSAAQAADERFFPGFKQSFVQTPGMTLGGAQASGATINALVGGSGPALMLIHGNPETHVAWHKVASALARRFTVVLPDLRGYGDSSKPDGGAGHVDYAKHVMAQDMVTVMHSLGFDSFQAVAHDRGARVLQQMMYHYPNVVTRGSMLDICPTAAMYGKTTSEFATKYFWWFLQIQDSPFPEEIINPAVRHYLDYHLKVQCKTAGAVTGEAYAEYLRCYGDPATVHGVCEDYRASATIDERLDAAERGRKIRQPWQALWGSKGTVGELFDVLGSWREVATDVSGRSLACGHLIAEEAPEQLLSALDGFLEA